MRIEYWMYLCSLGMKTLFSAIRRVLQFHPTLPYSCMLIPGFVGPVQRSSSGVVSVVHTLAFLFQAGKCDEFVQETMSDAYKYNFVCLVPEFSINMSWFWMETDRNSKVRPFAAKVNMCRKHLK